MADIIPIKLSELNSKIKAVLSQSFDGKEFWIIADITNHSYYKQKNYHFFDLTETDEFNKLVAKVTVSAFGAACTKIAQFEKVTGQSFTNNISILVKVAVSFHEVHGLKLNLIDVDANFTLGVMEQKRRETLEKLVSDNHGIIEKSGDRYITLNSRLQFPNVIQRIALISSKNSAGYEDFKHTIDGNPFNYNFTIDDYFTSVQGDLNVREFLNSIIAVFNSGIKYDAVVITRGGGAQTDFLIFDQYMVGKAIARFPIPIITGIGHQRNETIVDLMAHTQTKTPTKAAEYIIQHNRAFEESIIALQQKILIRSQQLFSYHFQRISGIHSIIINGAKNLIAEHKQTLVNSNRVAITKSSSILFNQKNELVGLTSKLLTRPRVVVYNRLNDILAVIGHIKAFNSKYIFNQKGYLRHHVSMIRVMSPDHIMKRGFAVIKYNGKLIINSDDIQIGEDIEVIFSGVQIQSNVKHKTKLNGNEFNL